MGVISLGPRMALVLIAVIAIFSIAFTGVAGAAVPAGNLVLNPGAEDGTGASDSFAISPVPQWPSTGTSFTAVQYGLNSIFQVLL